MEGIGKFFDKFKGVAVRELYKREVICAAIGEATRQKIEVSDISIKNGVITLKGSHIFKSEVFLKKKQILDLISRKLQKEKFLDIK